MSHQKFRRQNQNVPLATKILLVQLEKVLLLLCQQNIFVIQTNNITIQHNPFTKVQNLKKNPFQKIRFLEKPQILKEIQP